MNIALIGGAGFVGSVLHRHLESASHRVIVIDKRRVPAPGTVSIVADVRDADALERSLARADTVDTIVNLAAEHRDDVTPRSLYAEVNVEGAKNVCRAARCLGIKNLVFTSSVAVYGLPTSELDESGALNPFNDYGRTKREAENVYRAWLAEDPSQRALTIVRPTVIFGERNRGNVYNLLRQIAIGSFIMVGSGTNIKSMAYVENVAAFLAFTIRSSSGYQLYNYVDKPDFDMNGLVTAARRALGSDKSIALRVPRWVGMAGGMACDVASALLRRKLSISAIRIRKFCAATRFSSSRLARSGFQPPFLLAEGLARTIRYEFLEQHDDELYYTE